MRLLTLISFTTAAMLSYKSQNCLEENVFLSCREKTRLPSDALYFFVISSTASLVFISFSHIYDKDESKRRRVPPVFSVSSSNL